jgi:hypothetical protein
MRPDPIQTYRAAPLAELLAVVLRQFKRPLAAHAVTLTDAEAAEIAARIVAKSDLTPRDLQIRAALTALVQESETVLAGYGLTFAQSLDTAMTDMPGWETTADFLALAEIKTNAELRISTGSALVMALGDARFAAHLHTLIARADPDLDTVIAERVLAL